MTALCKMMHVAHFWDHNQAFRDLRLLMKIIIGIIPFCNRITVTYGLQVI